MNKFKQVVILEKIATAKPLILQLSKYSKGKIKYFDTPAKNDNDIIKRIGDADCVLVTWASKISANVINNTKLKYIGLCATLYKGKNSNIDLTAAESKRIIVKGISDYGDFGTVEFITSEVIRYFKDNGNRELKNKNIGIIGMDKVGTKVFKALNFFDANVYYYNHTRRKNLEKKGLHYLSKDKLLKNVEALVLCVPRNAAVLNKRHFTNLKANFLINVSMGTPFTIKDFNSCIKKPGKFATFDQIGAGNVRPRKNIRVTDYVSGFTEEAKVRQVNKVEENIISFFNKYV